MSEVEIEIEVISSLTQIAGKTMASENDTDNKYQLFYASVLHPAYHRRRTSIFAGAILQNYDEMFDNDHTILPF